MEAKRVICPNCGASIYENEASCPFCGYINIPGAEEKFMRDIKKTERDMSHIPDLQKAEYKKTVSKSSRIIFITIGITVVVAAVLIGIYLLFDKVIFAYDAGDAKAQMIWNKENYPILDEMYANEDYDGIVEFEYELYDQNRENKTNYNIYDWEHYHFIMGYRNYQSIEDTIAYMDKGEEISRYGKENLVYYCMWFYYRQYAQPDTYMIFTDEEIELLDEYREITNGYLFGRLGFTEEEADKLLKKAVDEYGYLNAVDCYDYGRKVGDRFK